MDPLSRMLRFMGHSKRLELGRAWCISPRSPPATGRMCPAPNRSGGGGITDDPEGPSHTLLRPATGLGLPGNYSFAKRLGAGAQGEVWLAVDNDTNDLRAVKVGGGGGLR